MKVRRRKHYNRCSRLDPYRACMASNGDVLASNDFISQNLVSGEKVGNAARSLHRAETSELQIPGHSSLFRPDPPVPCDKPRLAHQAFVYLGTWRCKVLGFRVSSRRRASNQGRRRATGVSRTDVRIIPGATAAI